MKKLNNVSNNFKGEFCMDCMEPVQNCCCNEIAFTNVEAVEYQGNKYLVVGEAPKRTNFDCETCTSYCCTECPRYTTY